AGGEGETPQDDHGIEWIEPEEAEPEQPAEVLQCDRGADFSVRAAGQECNRGDRQERRQKESTDPQNSRATRHCRAQELPAARQACAESALVAPQSSRRTGAGGGSQAVAS